MKKLYPLQWALCLLLLLSFTACKKMLKDDEPDNCAQIPLVKITGAKTTPYYTGDTIHLGTSITPLGLYRWTQTHALNDISSTDEVIIYSASKFDEGWYYLSVSYPDCASHNDSVHITVVNKPVTAPCTPTNNSVTFNLIPSVTFGSTALGIDLSYGCKNLSGNPGAGYPDLDIYFNPYWNGTEPEDGAYTLCNSFMWPDGNPYSICMTSLYSGIAFHSNPGTVYVTHAGGKLQVTFCGLTFSGTFGNHAYSTTASGQLTAP